MGRPHRISYHGALFHITARGNNKEKLFFVNKDYLRYIKLLKEYKKELDYRFFAYVLMPNHVHLLIQVGQKTTISKIMQMLNTAYSKYFTLKYRRVGHLFQGRFHSVLVDKDEYLFALTQYIHFNPVRAGLVMNPEDYRLSSCSCYFNEQTDSLVDTEDVLRLLESDSRSQREIYKKLIRLEAIQKSNQSHFRGRLKRCRVLGSDDFINKLTVTSGTKT